MVNLDKAIRDASDGIELHVKVVPGASRTRVAGMLGDRLKVQVAAPPEAGKANKALCELIARTLKVPRQSVAVTQGTTQPVKTVTIFGVDRQDALRAMRDV